MSTAGFFFFRLEGGSANNAVIKQNRAEADWEHTLSFVLVLVAFSINSKRQLGLDNLLAFFQFLLLPKV